MTRQEIKEELRQIRYYYARKAALESAGTGVMPNVIVERAEKYNEKIKSAPIRLYDLYICLYLQNNTQESLAEKWGYSVDAIKWLNRQLYDFFEQNMD